MGIAFTLPEHSELPCSGLTEDIQVKADLANRKIKQTSAFSDCNSETVQEEFTDFIKIIGNVKNNKTCPDEGDD